MINNKKNIKISISFIIFFIIFLFKNIFSLDIYNKINITYSYNSFYTGSIENKLFLAKNLFTYNRILLIANTVNYSEGVFIDSINNNYILFSNTNNFSNTFSLLVNYFEDDISKINIIDSFYFQSFYNYFLISVSPYYEENNKNFALLGLINYFLNTDLFLAIFDGQDIKKAIIFGTSSSDYPFYFSQYLDSNFNGFIILSLIDKNNYRDFIDTKLNFDTKRYNSDSILVTFIDRNLKVKKYFVLRLPNKIVDISIIGKSIDNVLLKIDFIDKISGYYISSAFVNINFNNATLANINTNIFNNFYVDNFLIDFKNHILNLKKVNTNVIFNKIDIK
jgi:hypothetical protein